MNKWIADAFNVIFAIINIFVFAGFAIAIIGAWLSPEIYGIYNRTISTLLVIGFFILYILFVGVVSTLISINETLNNIELSLKRRKRAKPNKSTPSISESKPPNTPSVDDDRWTPPMGGLDNIIKK